MRSATILLAARGVRAFADGFTALLLPVYLAGLGFSAFRVGVLATATLLGSAALTLLVGLLGHRAPARRLLLFACGLMLATGLAFAGLRDFWPLLLVGFLGTLNPSGGDVSVFVPLEQALLAHAGPAPARTGLFARYSLVGSLMGAAGALSVGLLDPLARLAGAPRSQAVAAAFALYGLIGLPALALYLRLPPAHLEAGPPAAPLGPSRRRVLALAALFGLDSFGGGFLVQSLTALWLFRRFGLSLAAAGTFFFWTGLLSAVSQLAAPWLARRIGLVRTMVFTHIPANLCIVAAAFAPDLPTVVGLMLVRATLSNMDVAARSAYVMAVVTPAERAAAAGVTNVPRSLAGGISPALAGVLYSLAPFAWPLVIGGTLKTIYDLLLLRLFSQVPPADEP
ncbi:MAG: major facilitator superfamily 1 [Phenylobacterium sp.]|nr:major facilitator superfamily 1 [Phenylobacterium sp.]